MTRCAALVVLAVLLAPTAALATQSAESRQPDRGRITGRVVAADSGAPLAAASVDLSAATPAAAAAPAKAAQSDENGTFEFADLPAGEFSLRVTRPGYQFVGPRRPRSMAAIQRVSLGEGRSIDVTLTMHRGAAIAGRIVDEYGEPLAELQVHALRWSYDAQGKRAALSAGTADVTDDLGQFRVYGLPPGDYAVVATGRSQIGSVPAFNLLARTDTAPTYFPGTPNLADAQMVSLGLGEEGSVQFAVSPGRTVRAAGRAVTSSDSPAWGVATIWPRNGDLATRSERVGADGEFGFGDLPPGEYWINISHRVGGTVEAASIPVTVGDDDVTDLSIVTRTGATIRGTVAFEGTRPRSEFRLATQPAEGRGSAYGLPDMSAIVIVEPDGRFEATNVHGRVTFTTMDDGWVVKSVTAGGADVLDTGIDLTGKEAVNGIRITVSNRLARVAGRVANDRDEPVSDYLVVLLRLDGVPPGDQGLRALRTDAAGRFETTKLRAGSYVVGVVEDLEPGYHYSPEFQERLRERGQRFRLGDGGDVQLELAPTPGLE